MVRVSDEEMAFRVFRTIEQIRGVYYLQRTIDHDGPRLSGVRHRWPGAGRDRAAGDGMAHQPGPGRTALAAGLSDEWAALAVRAAAAVGAEYAGVDLLPARDGKVYVLEVNGIPGWKGLQEATGIDVAGSLVDSPRAGVRRDRRGDRGRGQLACLLEVSAPEAGNVSPERHFHDTRYEDFLASAVAIGPALAAAGAAPAGCHHPRRGRGHLALDQVQHQSRHRAAARAAGAGRRREPAAPCATGSVRCWRRPRWPTRPRSTPRSGVRGPAGWARPSAEDVSDAPTVTLREAMALAAERDAVAREYTDRLCAHLRGWGAGARPSPAPRAGVDRGHGGGFLALLAAVPDTHIARKLGPCRGRARYRGGRGRSGRRAAPARPPG